MSRRLNYISHPESSGYRSYHFLARISPSKKVGRNYRIELQVRTFLEHYWATALETFSEIIGVDLKDPNILDKVDGAQRSYVQRYLEVFVYIAQLFAINEKDDCSLKTVGLLDNDLDGVKVPSDLILVKQWLNHSETFHFVRDNLYKAARQVSSTSVKNDVQKGQLFLLEISKEEQIVNVTGFSDMVHAINAYDQAERRSNNSNSVNSPWERASDNVLVYANSRKDLELAYPNYRIDQRNFLHKLDLLMKN